MQYRSLCKCMPKVSILGFGCMRFYRVDGSLDFMDATTPVDEKLVDKLIGKALDNGVNYYDTAYNYLGGQSESVVGKIFQGEKRQSNHIATKLPAWKVKTKADFDKLLDEQLKRLNTDYIDYYLVHALTKSIWNNIYELGILEFLDKIKKSGKVRAVGFSFHDSYPVFETIISSRPWDFCQIQYNYLDEEYQAGKKGLMKAAKLGINVIAMEPLLGGKLATQLPTEALNQFQTIDKTRTPVEWALKWVWNHKQISLLLSGMNAMDQVEENCRIANTATVDSLSKEELETIDTVKHIFETRIKVHCATCSYCMPCPNGVNIPRVFSLYNKAHKFNSPKEAVKQYNEMPAETNASNCTDCKECLSKCPHQLPIPELMNQIAEYFEREQKK